jgi:hypothetical protein
LHGVFRFLDDARLGHVDCAFEDFAERIKGFVDG